MKEQYIHIEGHICVEKNKLTTLEFSDLFIAFLESYNLEFCGSMATVMLDEDGNE